LKEGGVKAFISYSITGNEGRRRVDRRRGKEGVPRSRKKIRLDERKNLACLTISEIKSEALPKGEKKKGVGSRIMFFFVVR